METNERPLARSEGLVVEELGDELLIYDLDSDRAHSLSASAASVWRRCDGETRIDEIGAILGLGSSTVERAMKELAECKLFDTRSVAGTTRREATVKLARVGAAVASAPLIVSVLAPTPAMAVTVNFCKMFDGTNCGSNNSGCKTSGCCCCTPTNDGFFCRDTVAECPAGSNTMCNFAGEG